MAASTTPATPAKPTLPALDSIASVAPDELPASTGAALSDEETALAKAIVAACADGKIAVGAKCADRKDATATAARMRRLVARYLGAQTPPDTRKVGTRIVPKDGGQAWAIALVAPPEPTAEAPAEA